MAERVIPLVDQRHLALPPLGVTPPVAAEGVLLDQLHRPLRDLRISVGDVLGWLADGQTPAQIVADYPELTPDDIRACLAYAAARESHEVRLAAAA